MSRDLVSSFPFCLTPVSSYFNIHERLQGVDSGTGLEIAQCWEFPPDCLLSGFQCSNSKSPEAVTASGINPRFSAIQKGGTQAGMQHLCCSMIERSRSWLLRTSFASLIPADQYLNIATPRMFINVDKPLWQEQKQRVASIQ